MTMQQLLSTKDAARFLGVAPYTLRRARSRGMLCGVPAPRFQRIGTRMIRYELNELKQWLEQFRPYRNTAEYAQPVDRT